MNKLIQIFIVCSLSGILFVGCGQSASVKECISVRDQNYATMKKDVVENPQFADTAVARAASKYNQIDCTKYQGSEKTDEIEKFLKSEGQKLIERTD